MSKIIRQSIVMLAPHSPHRRRLPASRHRRVPDRIPACGERQPDEHDGKTLGSELIGQPFSDPKYCWSRPSATAPFADNSAVSTGSNLGPTNSALGDAVKQRIEALRAADPGNTAPVPVDLVTASGAASIRTSRPQRRLIRSPA